MTIVIKSDIDIKEYLTKQKNLIDNHLKKIFEDDFENNYQTPKELWDAVRYSLVYGGKRLRGILCLATYESLCKDPVFLNDCLTVACAIETLHAMSLIHDDLPSMDNDDLRRGKPSCHKAFSESTAILAGDAMLTTAFYLICCGTNQITNDKKVEIIKTLSDAFSFGLAPGQVLDLFYTNKDCDLKTIENIYKLKTAELIKASILSGGIIAQDIRKDKSIFNALNLFGLKIGIAFQIIDDILDITSDTKTLGKTSGKDEKQKKQTYPQKVGIQESKNIAKDLTSEAKSTLMKLPLHSKILPSLADYMINRIN